MTTVLYREDFPVACIEACSAPGDVSEAVEYWLDTVGLPEAVSREEAIDYLEATGGWERDELEGMGIDELHKRILWLACCTFNEGDDIFCLEA